MSKNELNMLAAEIGEYAQYLSELGVELLDCRLPDKIVDEIVPKPSTFTAEPVEFERFIPEAPLEPVNRAVAENKGLRSTGTKRDMAALPSLSSRKIKSAVPHKNLAQMGSVAELSEKLSDSDEQKEQVIATNDRETVADIQKEIGPDCMRCPLATQGRSKVVNTTGNFNADLMFVGEAPGADEDEQGKPFVGRAGQLLTKIIESIGIDRADVCIGNINRCRPPGNRKPEPVETAACRPFIMREIAVIKPKVVVVLGATAAHNLLDVKTPIGQLRGHFHDYFGVKVMPTFHPAYLLRDPHKKREVWEDMKKVRDFLAASK